MENYPHRETDARKQTIYCQNSVPCQPLAFVAEKRFAKHMASPVVPLDSFRPASARARATAARVSIHASDQLVAAGLRAMLDNTVGIELVRSVRDADVVVAVADARLGDLDVEPTRLVLITDEVTSSEFWSAIEHGLVVLVPRAETTKQRLLRAIEDAHQGRGDLPAEQLGYVLQALSRLYTSTLRPLDLSVTGVSSREVGVLQLLAEGMDTTEMAKALNYSERTVKNILYALQTRLHLRNRAHAVAYALRNGLI